jgi:hypothetical protein
MNSSQYESQEPDAIGREFHFRIAVAPLFPRLIVSILLYSRLANRGGTKKKNNKQTNKQTNKQKKNTKKENKQNKYQKRKEKV